MEEKVVIGSTEYVEIEGISGVPAKIDTGADSSSVWVSGIEMSEDGRLSFCLFAEECEWFSGERIEREAGKYSALVVRSSNGEEQVRYRTELELILGGKTFRTNFTLTNREKNWFPVLIGRKSLKGRFLVDVSERRVEAKTNPKTPGLNEELRKNPFSFHKKYVINTLK